VPLLRFNIQTFPTVDFVGVSAKTFYPELPNACLFNALATTLSAYSPSLNIAGPVGECKVVKVTYPSGKLGTIGVQKLND
jgi:hypothetical protein